jgi:hypothetical protein
MTDDVPDLLNEHIENPRPAVERQRTAKSAAKDSDRFFGCPMWWLDAVLPIVKSKGELVVAIYLFRLRSVRHSKTVDVSNEWLLAHGIGRYTKSRVFRRLTQAGLIRVKQKGMASPRVTFLR